MYKQILLALIISMTAFGKGTVTIFSMGRIDGNCNEFALAPDNWSAYSKTFKKDVLFRVGKDNIAKNFPFILPGPMDAWAGSKKHTFTIEFELGKQPAGQFLLLIGISRSHYAFPPTFSVQTNDHPPVTLSTIRDGKEQKKQLVFNSDSFRRGLNTIKISSLTGSWFHFDALQLFTFPAGKAPEKIAAIRLRDTIFFKGSPGSLKQVIRIEVDGIWSGRGTFHVSSSGKDFSVDTGKCAISNNIFEVGIPEVDKDTPVKVLLQTPAGSRAEGTVVARKHRHWRIFVAMKTHYDIGYTEPVEAMLKRASGPMLDKIYSYCDKTKDFGPEQRFIWTYPTWLIDKILERKDAKGKKKFEGYLKRGQIVWNAMPFSLHTYFCGLEDICRSVYGSKELDKRYGKNVLWAKQTDVPGQSRILPQVLKRSGIKLLQIGANNGVRGLRAPLVFYWQSPDGSRILTQLTAGYGWGWSSERLTTLEQYPRYPYNAFLALYVTGDNVGPGNLISIAEEAERLSKHYAFPRVQIGHVEDFTDWMEKYYKDRIPVVKTELADWWIHGVASQARASALARWTREALTWSERFNSVAVMNGLIDAGKYPTLLFREAYIQSLLYSEHTWGISGFKPMPRPESTHDLAENKAYDAMKKSWKNKRDYVNHAAKIARETLGKSLSVIAEAAAPEKGGLVVFNPDSWTRTDVVKVSQKKYPAAKGFAPVGGGPSSPAQLLGDELVFIARNVPAMGYRVYRAVNTNKGLAVTPGKVSEKKNTIENSFYRIKNNEKGAVISIIYKPTGMELLDRKAAGLFNQYIYEGYDKISGAGWHGSPYRGKGTGRVTPGVKSFTAEIGPVYDRLVLRGSLMIPNFPVQIGEVREVIRSVTLWKELDRVDCEVILKDKKETAVAEAGHVAFPFNIPGGHFRLEQLGAITDPVNDIQDEGNRDTFAVQHWVDISNDEIGVTWATVDAPLVSVGDIRIFSWDPDYVPKSTHLYSCVLNNGWSTNFQEFQGGDFRFRYSFRAHKGSEPDTRFGWETSSPLIAYPVKRGTGTLGNDNSFFKVAPSSIVLVNLKRAEDGHGFVLRLFETTGRKTDATIKCGKSVPGRAVITRLTEDSLGGKEKTLTIKNGFITTTLGPFEIQTIRIQKQAG